jgi:hypothetical protein
VLEVPHQGRGVEEADGGDAQTGWLDGSHCFLEYQSCAEGLNGNGDVRATRLTSSNEEGSVGKIAKEFGFRFPMEKLICTILGQ